MDSLEILKAQLEEAVPSASLEVVINPAVPAQGSLVVAPVHALSVARLLRDQADLAFDLCSNVTGVDWPERTEKLKVKRLIDGAEKEVEEARTIPGYLEVVYHLYSVARKEGPLVIRQRTINRGNDCSVASLTSIWRSCEFQEREVFDLFGVNFEGHPDLRRILMWDGFVDHPMRKDYVEPDDYEYEPTPHDDVLEKAEKHFPGK
ncbi:MAG TPA: NADH-quinone oxidoreductase subunit C [Verrucomicrobiota bacterium]|nr:NADH-quinone oxidoreductase subunit C [Verrucomicrobiota bacterium]